ncbi:MAG: outer membrane protein multidrug efflux system, partial [Thermoanaerobaculia bacterium]|nr:outer membrane protein multidrug efflux system [Thermoanaerobaculia bacterium]
MRRLVLTALFVIPMGCTAGPNYTRPIVSVPDSYRQPYSTASSQQAESLGDEKWWDVFQDAGLQQLIRTAIENNYDVRIAASRVLQARAQLGITRAGQFPSVNAGAGIINQRATSQQSGSVQTA